MDDNGAVILGFCGYKKPTVPFHVRRACILQLKCTINGPWDHLLTLTHMQWNNMAQNGKQPSIIKRPEQRRWRVVD